MTTDKKNIIVTGGNGFIGHHLVDQLIETHTKDYNIYVIDRDMNIRPNLLHYERNKDITLLTCDFCGPMVENILNARPIHLVFHLAAQPRVEYSVHYPYRTHEDNVSKTVWLLEKLRNHPLENFVFSSSSAVYGDASIFPTPITSQIQPQSPYGLQKYEIERYLQLFHKLYQMPYSILRYANVYGPGQLGNSPYATAISSWINAIKSNRPLRFDGDGTQSRDLVHVESVVWANIDASKICPDQIINVGSGCSISNNEIIDMLREYFPNIQITKAPPRLGDVKKTQLAVDNNELYHIDFREGLERTLRSERLII